MGINLGDDFEFFNLKHLAYVAATLAISFGVTSTCQRVPNKLPPDQIKATQVPPGNQR